jgi:hypothetical protein
MLTPDEGHAVGGGLLRDGGEVARLGPARRAPRRPEVEDDDLAAQVGEVERLALERLAAEHRRGLAVLDPQQPVVGSRAPCSCGVLGVAARRPAAARA